MAQIAQESAATEYGRLIDLIKSLFSMNQLLRYARENGLPEDPWQVPQHLHEPNEGLDQYFRIRRGDLRRENEGDEQSLTAEEEAILQAGLSPFDTFIEVITHVRQKHHLKYLTEMMDKLLQKNSDFGALIQGKSVNNLRRWHLGGRLLEVFVQLAVLRWEEAGSGKRFSMEPILIEGFLRWLEARYGFVVGIPSLGDGRRPISLDEHRAYRENLRALKDRLREIGFYDDLSDAYIAQTIRPRYRLDRNGGPA
jgi:hypothetical protein